MLGANVPVGRLHPFEQLGELLVLNVGANKHEREMSINMDGVDLGSEVESD